MHPELIRKSPAPLGTISISWHPLNRTANWAGWGPIASWSALGGGRMVHVKHLDVHRIARYLAKDLTKDLMMSAPEGSRRVTTSRSLHLNEKKIGEITWVLDVRSIFHRYALLRAIAQDAPYFLCRYAGPSANLDSNAPVG